MLSKYPCMSASTTYQFLYNSFFTFSVACFASLFGRNPYELSKKFASKIGFITILQVYCTILSLIVGIPNGLCFPSGFGIYTLFTGFGLYFLFCKSSWISNKYSSTPYSSIISKVMPSIPALPLFARTSFHARHKISRRKIRSYNA